MDFDFDVSTLLKDVSVGLEYLTLLGVKGRSMTVVTHPVSLESYVEDAQVHVMDGRKHKVIADCDVEYGFGLGQYYARVLTGKKTHIFRTEHVFPRSVFYTDNLRELLESTSAYDLVAKTFDLESLILKRNTHDNVVKKLAYWFVGTHEQISRNYSRAAVRIMNGVEMGFVLGGGVYLALQNGALDSPLVIPAYSLCALLGISRFDNICFNKYCNVIGSLREKSS